ncbi:MAG: NAD(P)-binding domain-containing protein, partial [Gammaproteobacteria bacterium]
MDTQYGFIGVGRMGSLMSARLLAAGHAVAVYDTSEAAIAAAVANGATAAISPAAVADAADVVFL